MQARQGLIDAGRANELEPARPSFLVTLPALIDQVKREITKVCGSEVRVVDYRGQPAPGGLIQATLTRNHTLFDTKIERNARTIIVTSYRTLAARHGPNSLPDRQGEAGLTATERRVAKTEKPAHYAWERDLGGLIKYCFADECNAIKNRDSHSNWAIVWLEAFNVLVTGTVEGNRIEDVLGLAKLIQPSEIDIAAVEQGYEIGQLDDFDPYDEDVFPDDSEVAKVLRLKYKNAEKYLTQGNLTTRDPSLLGKRLASFFAVSIIKRCNVSEVPGKGRIGEEIPTLTARRLYTRFDSDEQGVYNAISAGAARKLVQKGSQTGKLNWNFKYLGRLILFSQWTGYRAIYDKFTADKLPKVLNRDDLLDYMCKLVLNKGETLPDDVVVKIAMLLKGSPKARALVKILRKVVVQDDEKLIIYCTQPSQMAHILAILKGLQIGTSCYHAGLNREEKDAIIINFNKLTTENGIQTPKVLLTTVVLAGIGLNLQYCCHRMVFMDPPIAQYLFEQACCRIHRLGQIHDVNVYTLVQEGSFNKNMVDNTLKKAAPGLIASLNKEFGLEIGEDEMGERTVELGDWVVLDGILVRTDDDRVKDRLDDLEVLSGLRVIEELLSNRLGAKFEAMTEEEELAQYF